jgi:hypothetical protein
MATRSRRFTPLGLAAVWLFAFGCADSRPALYRVTGTVSFDGRPVEGGEIIFVPVDKGAAPDAGRIDNGAYDMLAKAGKKRVEIRASRPVVGGKPNPMGPVYQDYIPEKYNARTTLAADVKPDGENRFDYELKSAKK